MPTSRLSDFAPLLLRIGLAFLFLWFGFSQILHPEQWTSWVPAWVLAFGVSATNVVLLNGWFELILGTCLAFGFYTRIVTLLLSLHLYVIAYEIGLSAIGVRDFTIATSCLALSAFGKDRWSLL